MQKWNCILVFSLCIQILKLGWICFIVQFQSFFQKHTLSPSKQLEKKELILFIIFCMHSCGWEGKLCFGIKDLHS